MTNKTGYFVVQSWAGAKRVRVEVVGETPKRYQVRLLEDARMPGRNQYKKAGELVSVPKDVLRFEGV